MAKERWIYRAGELFLLLVVAAGCNGDRKATPENLTRGLNFYFSNNDNCLFPSAIRFPYEAGTSSGDVDKNKAGLDALAAAGLLRSLEDRDIHVKRYELTPYGSHVPPRFCYGHRVVTSIVSFSPPAAVDRQLTTQVDYHYKMMDVPGWADSDQIRKAFPAFVKATSGDPEDHATLVLTVNGWRIPE
jgi:hypothetical protein